MDRRSPADGGSLSHLRVIDLTQGIGGPFATKLLAGQGAEVIKVERPGGDPARAWSPMCRSGDSQPHSALFSFLNTNKSSVVLNLKDTAARDVLLRLVATSDVVCESYCPGTLARLGLSFEELQHARPGIVLTSISNFGQKGSLRDFEATELNIFAFGGRMAASGTRPRPPVRLLGGSGLFMAGTVAAVATLAALRGRKIDGHGDHLDISIANAIIGEPDRGFCLYGYSYINMERLDGHRPYQSFPAADGFVVINVNRGIERVANMIGRPELSTDPRFTSNQARLDNADELEPMIIEWTVSRTKAEIIHAAREHRVIAAPVATIPEVLEQRVLRDRGFFRTVSGSACRCQSLEIGPPFRNHLAPGLGWQPQTPAPELGQDTERVLTELAGLSSSEVGQITGANTGGAHGSEPVPYAKMRQ